MSDTPAHDRAITNHYKVHYPAHPPRTGDPHYVDFEAYRRKTHKTAKCAIGAHRGDFSECRGLLELHHAHVEFSLQNGVDLKWLEADYPGISDPDHVGAWVESAANLEWLCVLPDVPVRMADRSEKAIADVKVGELVMTHDGTAQPVLATCRKPYSGEVLRLGSATLTPTHRVLTHIGWVPATEVAHQLRMHGPHVIGLRCEEEQVIRGIVSPISVDVMDTFSNSQRASDHPFHHPAMLHDRASAAAGVVDDDADVAARRDSSTGAVMMLTRRAVERQQAAAVRAVVDGFDVVAPQRKLAPAVPAGRCDSPTVCDLSLPFTHAAATARGVPPRNALRRKEMLPTDDALPFGEQGSGFYGGWYALREVRNLTYTGYVHDITIANSHSFIAGGMVVHNCEFHHRGHGGVHVSSASDFEAEKYVRGLIS